MNCGFKIPAAKPVRRNVGTHAGPGSGGSLRWGRWQGRLVRQDPHGCLVTSLRQRNAWLENCRCQAATSQLCVRASVLQRVGREGAHGVWKQTALQESAAMNGRTMDEVFWEG